MCIRDRVNVNVVTGAQGDLLAIHLEPRRRGLVVAQRPAQEGQPVAQIGERLLVGAVGGEKAGQGVAALGNALVNGQPGQQDALGIGAEFGLLPTHLHLERAKHGNS